MFIFTSIIDAGESKMNQKSIQDKIQWGGNPNQTTSKPNGIKQGLMLGGIQNGGWDVGC